MSLAYPPPFMSLAVLSEHVCCGASTIKNWVRLGKFPAPKRVGGKLLWEWKAVQQHLAPDAATPANPAATTAAPADKVAELDTWMAKRAR
jgi:predicted DNA-binding transcriptional regulator AlpA